MTDIRTNGPEILQFTRHYNSQSNPVKSPRSVDLGLNWRSSFDSRLVKVLHDSEVIQISALRADGRGLTFDGEGFPNNDVPDRLVRVGANWEYRTTDGTVEIYDDATGLLISIIRRSGYWQNLAYDSNGKLASVTDSFGRMLAFTHLNGRLDSVTGPDLKVTRYVYINTENPDTAQLSEVIYPDESPGNNSDNPRIFYLYEDPYYPAALTGIIDENGTRFATWVYGPGFDSKPYALSSEHANVAQRTTIDYFYEYYENPRSRLVTNALGKDTIYRFGIVAATLKVTQVEGAASANCQAANAITTYDANGFVASTTDHNGNVTTFVNDALGRPVSRTEAAGTPLARTTTTEWHPAIRLPTRIVAPGRTTNFTYDAAGRLLTRTETDTTAHTVPYSTNGQARTWTYTYNAAGLLASADGPRTDVADVTAYAYTPAGYLSRVTNALGHVTDIAAHDGLGRPLTAIDANGVTTQLAYDARGRLTATTVVDAGGNATTSYTYDAVGQVTRLTRPDGSYLDFEYDGARRLTAVSNGLGERIEYTVDALGNRTGEVVKSGTGAIARTQTRVFDELGRLLRSIGAAGQTTSNTYDRNDNIVATTDPLNRTTSFAYDALNRLIRVTDAQNGLTDIGYDARNNRTSLTDAVGIATTYVYNGFGDLIRLASPDSGATVYAVDAAGNRVSRTDARGVVTNYVYDALNRLSQIAYPGSPGENVTYAYDDATAGNKGVGRLTDIADESGTTALDYDARGNLVRESRHFAGNFAAPADPDHDTVYAYDLADNLVQVTYPSGRIVNYQRDSLGRVVGVTTRPNATAAPEVLAHSISYAPFGGLTSLTYGNGRVHTRTYDQDGRLTTLRTLKSGLSAAQKLTYAYDAAGSVTAITDQADTGRNQSFAYDALNRLAQAAGQNYGDITYDYDAVGNRVLSQTTLGTSTTTETYTYAADSHRLLSVSNGAAARQFTYDAAGNMVAETEPAPGGPNTVYNHAGRPASSQGAAGSFSYVFNARGLRAVKADGAPSTTRFFHYDRDGRLIVESDLSGAMLREFVSLDGLKLALYNAGSSMRYVHADHLGGPQKMTNADGTVRWDLRQKPFGELVAAGGGAAQNPQRFPGQYHDAEFGLHQNHFRDYDPSLGRYLQSDPIGLDGGINTYAYVGNNPLRWTDPTGENPAAITVAVPAAAIIGRILGGTSLGALLGSGIQKFKEICKDDDDDKCKKQERLDEAICRSLSDPGARSRCWESTAARFGACTAGNPLPPLITW